LSNELRKARLQFLYERSIKLTCRPGFVTCSPAEHQKEGRNKRLAALAENRRGLIWIKRRSRPADYAAAMNKSRQGKHRRAGKRGTSRGLLRQLTFVLAVALALTTFQHLTGTHGTHAHAEGALAEMTAPDTPGIPCDQEERHLGGLCHAADSCSVYAQVVAATAFAAPIAETAVPTPAAAAASTDLSPHRHPPKLLANA
jgi:hypothetical protein